MGSAVDDKLDASLVLSGFRDGRARVARSVLNALVAYPDLRGMFVGGSVTHKGADAHSDLDVFCVCACSSISMFESLIGAACAQAGHLLWLRSGRSYPWFGHLTTAYWAMPQLFAMDIGVISAKELDSFFVEPRAFILHDSEGAVARRQAVVCGDEQRRLDRLLRNRLADAVSVSVKLCSAVERGHYWNGIEHLNQLRRAYVSVWRSLDPVIRKRYHVGRPERDIEDYAAKEFLDFLASTVPTDRVDSLARSALTLMEALLRWEQLTWEPGQRCVLNEARRYIQEWLVRCR